MLFSTRRFTWLVLPTALLATACNSGSTSSSAGPSGSATSPTSPAPTPTAAATPAAAPPAAPAENPCSLVSKADAEAILGAAVHEPAQKYGGCVYFLVTQPRGTLASMPWMSVTRTHGTRQNFDAAVKAYEREGPATPVSGLGDHAVTASGFLFVYKGDNIVSIQPGNTAIPAQQVRDFAVKALAHL